MNYLEFREEQNEMRARLDAHRADYLARCPFQPGDAVYFKGDPYVVFEVVPSVLYDYSVGLRKPKKNGGMPTSGFAGHVRPCDLEHRPHA